MAVSNKDPSTYEKEKDRFIQELQHFHETRGTPSRRPPKINGQEIDLYLLYTVVTARGGWLKVNSRNEWDEVLAEFDIPQQCVNSSVAIKQIYLRYLDRYEKIHYLGEIGERGADDDEDSRHRRWSARALHSVPLTYNHSQHNVNESLREYNGLSVDMYKPSEYEKLTLSLISPLPNEQDFAINICTLLSNEGKHCLKLEKHKRLLHFLLAHAAVFSTTSLRILFNEMYGKDRGHSMNHLWGDTVSDPSILRLADETHFSDQPGAGDTGDHNSKTGLKLEKEDNEIFCLGRTLGVQDYIGQRVCQIATIVRNLTFVSDNAIIMGKDLTFLRFVLLCCNSNWNGLHQMGWDMLGNIATEITVQCPLIEDILLISAKGLYSQDRAVILSSLEVLNKLSQSEKNEDIILRSLTQEAYGRICSFLTLHDIMLLVYTLECLNSISSLGEKACNSILRVRGALDVLVSLITVEAQSYGPKACIQMRVVETVTGTANGVICQTTQTSTVASTSTSTAQSTTATPPTLTQATTTQCILTPVPTVTPVSHQTTAQRSTTPTHTKVIQPTITSTSSTTNSTITTSMPNSIQATQQVAQENEQYALSWLRSTFEPLSTGKVEQAELYKQYINYCAKIGRRGVIAPLHFPRCVRTVFGAAIGPKQAAGDSGQHFYEGIQQRAKPLIPQVPTPTPSTTTTQVSTIQNTPSPILKAQLSAPPKGTSTNSQPLKVTQRQQQQRLLQQQPNLINSVGMVKLEELSQSKGANMGTFQNKTGLNCKINGLRNETENIESPNGSISSNDISSRPPPLTPLTTKFTTTSMMSDETGSASNSLASSSGNRDICSGEEGDNSSGSFDGFLLNGVPSSLDMDDATSKDSTPKSLMLADLLEKNVDKNEAPVLNGSLRIGDKGLELVQGIKKEPEKVSIGIGDHSVNGIDFEIGKVREGLKRPASEPDTDITSPKKPHLNGDIKIEIKEEPDKIKEEPPEEGNVSSTAANLYAALAADTLEDEPMDEIPTPPPPPPPVMVNPAPSRQILVTAGGQLTQRVVVGGQHYVVTQPQTALVQGQTQTVLLAQTTQQQGTSAKTIIILQPQTVSANAHQKVIVQRLQSPPPPALIATTQQTGSNIRPNPPKHQTSSTSLQKTVKIVNRPHVPVTASMHTQSVIASNVSQITNQAISVNVSSASTAIQTTVNQNNCVSTPTPISNTTSVITQASSHNILSTTTQIPVVSMPSLQAPCATPVCVCSTSPISISSPSPMSPSTNQANTITVSSATSTPVKSEQGLFLCEWRGCMRNFKSANEVYMHACEAHCPQGTQEIQCLWERCDAMKRKRFSLMTHLFDRHCNADVMRMMAVRRKQLSVSGRSEIPAPTPATPHPGYAPNAAFHAIKRHALEFVNPKELQQQRAVKPGPIPVPVQTEQDDNEGPVTKSIRLTAALILRNLVVYSTHGRRHLTRYEPHLASVALSNVESSRTIAHVLFDMSNPR